MENSKILPNVLSAKELKEDQKIFSSEVLRKTLFLAFTLRLESRRVIEAFYGV